MIRLLATTDTDCRCAHALIESDRRYFEMGAIIERMSVGELTWMTDLTDLAASCVVQRIDFDRVTSVSDSWLDQIHAALQRRSVAMARVYLDNCPDYVHALFLRHGYTCRSEIGFLAPDGYPSVPANMRLCPVLTDADWRQKRCLHEQAMEGPDGYTNQADLWVEMEYRKCATGKMQSFLVRRDDEIVATVGAIVHDGLLRLKNIVVSPRYRRCGVGIATVHLLWQLAEQEHDCRLGVFGVEGAKGSKLYRRAGLYEVTSQYEWSRLMTGEK